jgi:hypothetical protein
VNCLFPRLKNWKCISLRWSWPNMFSSGSRDYLKMGTLDGLINALHGTKGLTFPTNTTEDRGPL